jgi:hypothetical protein
VIFEYSSAVTLREAARTQDVHGLILGRVQTGIQAFC